MEGKRIESLDDYTKRQQEVQTSEKPQDYESYVNGSSNEDKIEEVVGLVVVKRDTNYNSIRIWPDRDDGSIEILCEEDFIKVEKSEIQTLIDALKKYL